MLGFFYFMQERKDLLAREKNISERSYSTAANFRIVNHFIEFPPVLSKLRILDIGTGASPAVLELNRRGARAIAYDIRYEKLGELQESVERYIGDPSYSSRQENTQAIKKLFDEEVQVFPATEAYKNIQISSLKIFLEAAKKRELSCVAGIASHLPFRDESFDFVYSLQTISQFLLEDRDVFMQSIMEALRVLKTDGQLKLHPWEINPYALSQSPERQSMVALMRFLKERKMPYRIEQFYALSPRIVVFKK